jgi:hypothetical protein
MVDLYIFFCYQSEKKIVIMILGFTHLNLFFLVPKPRLGNALAGEAPASRDGRRPEAGASGADAFPSWGLGTRKKYYYFLSGSLQ